VGPKNVAVLVLATCACIGCEGTTQGQRDEAYAIARRLPGVDDSTLMIPTDGALGYPSSTTNPLAVRRLLRQGEFDRLDSLLEALADSARRDYRNEYYLFDAYEAMAGDTSLAQPLGRWERERPTSAPARIAKGAFLADLAWQTRGTAYSRNTPAESIQRMGRLMAQAVSTIDTALDRTPRSAAAYRVLLETAKASGDTALARRYLMKGLEDIPASFSLRRQYMRNLIPRWGGSYDAMRRFADESQATEGATNPRLRGLAGYIALDSAEVLELQGHQLAALAVYDEAIAISDEASFHLERGQLLVRMRRDREAMRDLDRAVAGRPTDATAYLWRGLARLALSNDVTGARRDAPTGALSDFQHAVVLRPSDPVVLDRFAWLHARMAFADWLRRTAG
jgi:tetratricopeptide (TPR) repeat protein